MARAFADPAVGDDLPIRGHALALVQCLELLRRLERAVVVRRLDPRDVHGRRDVARHLRLLLRQVIGGQLLPSVFLRRADVHEGRLPNLGQDLVAEGPDLGALVPFDPEPRGLDRRRVLGELAALQFPLLPPAVQELHVIEAPELQEPVSVRGEPVVVASIHNHRRPLAHAGARQQVGELRLRGVLPAHLRVQVGAPVPRHGAGDVPLLVGLRVLVDLDQPDAGVVQVLLEPVRLDQRVGIGVRAHRLLLPLAHDSRRQKPSMDRSRSPSRRSGRRGVQVCPRVGGGAATAQPRGDHGPHQPVAARSDHGIPTPRLGFDRDSPRVAGAMSREPATSPRRPPPRRRPGLPLPPRTSSPGSTAGGAPSRHPRHRHRGPWPGAVASVARSAARWGSPSW
jgi:hypothetical protein